MLAGVLQQAAAGGFLDFRRQWRSLMRIGCQVVQMFRAGIELQHQLKTLFAND